MSQTRRDEMKQRGLTSNMSYKRERVREVDMEDYEEIAESLKVERVWVEPDPFPKDPFVTRKVLERRWSCW